MQSKVKDLNNVISLDPPDMKKLQLRLGGSVSVQVCGTFHRLNLRVRNVCAQLVSSIYINCFQVQFINQIVIV